MNSPKIAFLKNLRFWSFHCSFTALPSLFVAGTILDLFRSPVTTLPMIVGVLIFILSYTLLSTFLPALRERKSLFSRALHLALKIRSGISIWGLVGVTVTFLISFHPDFWAGIAAKLILEKIYSFFFTSGYDLSQSESFIAILLWTLTEGVILSFLLFLIAFFCLIGINARQRRRLTVEASLPSNAQIKSNHSEVDHEKANP